MESPDSALSRTNSCQRVLTCIAALCTLLFTARFWFWNFDDGCIVARIVRNLLEGNGWSFNPAEPFNTSTSVLNPFLIYLLTRVSGLGILTVSHLLGVIAVLLSVILARLLLSPHLGNAISFLTATVLGYILSVNATWGLEIHLFVCLSLLFLYFEKKSWDSWPLLGLLVLTRPDALLLCLAKTLREIVVTRKIPLLGLTELSIMLAPWAVYSLLHFQQIFPDTLSAKIWQGRSGYWGHGHIYFHGLREHLLTLLPSPAESSAVLVFACAGLLVMFRQRSLLLYLVLFVAVQQGVYVILNVPAYHWYFAILDAVIVLCCGFSLQILKSQVVAVLERPIACYFLGGLTLIWAAASYRHYPNNLVTEPRVGAYAHAAQTINQAAPPGAIAAVEVGVIGFHTTRPIVDLTALTSKNHEFITGRYNDDFFANPPAAILAHLPEWYFERAILDDVRFRLMYEPMVALPSAVMSLQYAVRKQNVPVLSNEEVRAYLLQNFPAFTSAQVPRQELSHGACIIDQINGQMPRGGEVELKSALVSIDGWAIDRSSESAPNEIFVALEATDKHVWMLAAERKDRPDVAENLKTPGLIRAGFSAKGQILDLPKGDYQVQILQKEGEIYQTCAPATLHYR